MTLIKIWKCNICGKEFRPDSSGYDANVEVDIVIPSASRYETDAHYHFDDTCTNCRNELILAIDKLIK
jgi:hypothetical protein